MTGNQYGEDYFMRGQQCGISNYTNYRWLKEPTIALAKRLVEVLDIKPADTVLDYACARGFLVKAFRLIGVDAWGYDISDWAIQNCHPDVTGYVSTGSHWSTFDHITGKDFFEHVPEPEMSGVMRSILGAFRKNVLLIVPLSRVIGQSYIRPEDNSDVTHVVRWPLETWLDFVQSHVTDDNVSVSGSWHIPGLKPSSPSPIKSCGFIHIKRYQ